MARSSILSYLASGMCRPNGPLRPTRRAGHFLPAATNCSANGTRTMSPRTPSLQVKIAPVKCINLYAPWYYAQSLAIPSTEGDIYTIEYKLTHGYTPSITVKTAACGDCRQLQQPQKTTRRYHPGPPVPGTKASSKSFCCSFFSCSLASSFVGGRFRPVRASIISRNSSR